MAWISAHYLHCAKALNSFQQQNLENMHVRRSGGQEEIPLTTAGPSDELQLSPQGPRRDDSEETKSTQHSQGHSRVREPSADDG